MFYRDNEKNKLLIQQRGISFEDIIDAIEHGKIIDDIIYHNILNYPNQRVLIINLENYIYKVPYIIDEQWRYCLKTIYPDRKATKQYINK